MDLTKHSFSIADLRYVTPKDAYWYLASPYSKYANGLNAAFVDVCDIAAMFIRERVPVFAPIAHSHPIAINGEIDPLDHGIWLPADAPLMRAAHGLIVCELDGWADSYGIRVEIEEFRLASKPIHSFNHRTMELRAYDHS